MKRGMVHRFVILWAVLAFLVPAALSAAAEDGTATFGLSVSTDYHLNQDGRPVPDYDFLVPLYADDESVLFFNPRYHIDDQTNLHKAEEWNLGLGYRKMIGDRAVLGANVFYDWRRSMTGSEFEQVGAGLELMTEDVTARLNGYLALSGPEEVGRHRWREYYFAPRSINYTDYERVTWEVPTSGFDGEVGFKVPYISDYAETWVYGGGYYFEPVSSIGGAETMEGIKGRIEVKPTDYLKASCEIRDDNVRGTAYYGEIAVEVPFSIENLVAGKNPFAGLKEKVTEPAYEVALADRMYDKVVRDPDIITGYTAGTPGDSDIVINNGVLESVRYVKNTAAAGGDGSYATPFNSITGALDTAGACPFDPAAEVIFVLAGSTLATYANKYGDFEINTTTYGGNGTTIWGQGYKPGGVSMPHGLGVSYPKIYGTATISADDVEIMGLSFNPPTNATHTDDPGMILNGNRANVHHNEFRPTWTNAGITMSGGTGNTIQNNKFYGWRGIEITGGNGAIMNNAFTISYTGTGTWTPYSAVTDPGIYGIYANVSSGDLGALARPLLIEKNKISITNTNTNAISGPAVFGIDLNVTETDRDLYATISNNTLTVKSTCPAANGTSNYVTEGIHLYAEDSINTWILGNTISAGITGKYNTTGIGIGNYYGTGGGYSNIAYFGVERNTLKVTSLGGDAYGIYCGVEDQMLARLTENNLSAGVSGKHLTAGIYLWSDDDIGFDGSTIRWVGVSNNKIKASSTFTGTTSGWGEAYGIYAEATDDLFIDIFTNDLSYGIAGKYLTSGILLDADDIGTTGSLTDPVLLFNNKLKVTSSAGIAGGINCFADNHIYADVIKNNLSLGVTAYTLGAGITMGYDCTNPTAELYTDWITANVNDNLLKVSSTFTGTRITLEGTAVGIGIRSGATGLEVVVDRNNLSYGISGKWDASGINIQSDGDTSFTIPSLSYNILKVSSPSRYASGIQVESHGAAFIEDTVISNNNLSSGISGSFIAKGIYVEAGYDNQGDWYADSSIAGLDISSNILKVTSSGDYTFGISLQATNDIYNTSILGNNMTAGISGKNSLTAGILFTTYDGSIGYHSGAEDPVLISGNSMKVASSAGLAAGIALFADGDYASGKSRVIADITKNDLSLGVTGYLLGVGIIAGVDGWTTPLTRVYSDWVDADVSENLLKISATSASGIANGIYLGSEGMGLRARINKNNASYGITGTYDATGILVETHGDGEFNMESIRFNTLKVTSPTKWAGGIILRSYSTAGLNGYVEFNDMSLGINGFLESHAIVLESGERDDETEAVLTEGDISGVKVRCNIMTVSSSGSDAHGIYLRATRNITDTTIEGNSMSGGLTGKKLAQAIDLMCHGNIGSYVGSTPYPVKISNNSMKVISSTGWATGIVVTTDDPIGEILAEITNNDMSWGISGSNTTSSTWDGPISGILLKATEGTIGMDIGGTLSPTIVSGNILKVTNTNATLSTRSATGIYGSAGSDLVMDIYNNLMTIKAYSGTSAATLEGNLIGQPYLSGGPRTYFNMNMGTVERTLSSGTQYLLRLNSDSSGTGNNVDWWGNSIAPVTGGWNGEYPTLNIGPISHNFTLIGGGGNDYLTP